MKKLDQFSEVGLRRLAKLFLGAHMIEVRVRKDGKTTEVQGDYLKDLHVLIDNHAVRELNGNCGQCVRCEECKEDEAYLKRLDKAVEDQQ